MFFKEIRDHVDIVRRPKASVHRARDRAAYVPGNSQPVQKVDERGQRFDKIVVPFHPTAF